MPEFQWLWLGTWSLGGEGFGPSDSRDSLKVLEKALACGIRHIDTAGFYAHGESEKLVAKVIGNNREEVFISSKGGLVWEGNRVLHKAGADDLRKVLMKSLDRLKTDYIDLFQLHWPDPDVRPDHRRPLPGLQAPGSLLQGPHGPAADVPVLPTRLAGGAVQVAITPLKRSLCK